MKKIILFISLITILFGCGNQNLPRLVKYYENDESISKKAKVDDIDGWDINIDDVESATCWISLKGKEKNEYQPISNEDFTRLIEAFNAIQKSDINWDSELIEMDYLFHGYFSYFV